MKKRILQIIPTLDRTAAEKQMGLLARGLPHEEFDVHVCALTHGGPLSADLAEAGIPVTAIGRRWHIDPQTFWQLRRHVSQLRPHLIHTWLSPANAYGLAAARVCGVKRLVAGLHSIEPRSIEPRSIEPRSVEPRSIGPWGGWLELAFERYLWKRCSAVVVDGPSVRDFYARHGFPSEKIRVFPHGVAPSGPNNTTRRQLLAELGLPEQSRLIGLVGGLQPQKRVKDAIWAADLLKVIRDDVHLLVIGDGPHRDRLYRFRDQVVIRDKVHFLGERGDVSRLMPHFDVLWSTGPCNGQSNAVMEAMVAAVPVVAADGPTVRQLVVPQRTGYLVPTGDRAGIARCTNKLLDNAELASQLGQAGRKRMVRQFNVEKMVEQYVGLYRELLGNI